MSQKAIDSLNGKSAQASSTRGSSSETVAVATTTYVKYVAPTPVAVAQPVHVVATQLPATVPAFDRTVATSYGK
jgi:hypothetical protein